MFPLKNLARKGLKTTTTESLMSFRTLAFLYVSMHEIHAVSNNPNFILYAVTTLNSPLCSFTHDVHNDVKNITVNYFCAIDNFLLVNG